jgi:hypothetical protein
MSFEIQKIIHELHAGAWARVLKLLFVLLVVGALAGLYDVLAYRNFSNREAMDMAQVARNLTDGKGFTTLVIRPFSIFLLQNHRPDHSPMLKSPHPDLMNPPVYPAVLAGVFKLIPPKRFAAPETGFSIYVPDLVVAAFNQALLLVAAFLLFFLAKRLFDSPTAWVSSIIFTASEVLWRFSVSGLNTLLLIVLLLTVVWSLVILEHWARIGRADPWLVSLAALTGVLVGVGGLTRYAFAWFIVPVLVFLIAFLEQRRAVLFLAAFAGFLAVMSPWIMRNYSVSGLPFGTATFSVWENTSSFQEDRLQRSLHPDLRTIVYKDFSRKFLQNARDVVSNDLPKLGGSWVVAFFAVGLIVPFRKPALSHLRWLLLFCLIVFALVQSLNRTFLSVESPEINSENMLVLLVPLVFMYATALFFLLLDSTTLPFLAARGALIVAFCALSALPLAQRLLPPHMTPVAYPPYYPPLIQRVSGWFNDNEMLMSDIPWAVAYYGRRQCLLTTLNWKKDFVEITDALKPIKGLYLTPLTTDTPFLSTWVRGENRSWAAFLLESISQREVPTGFPLRRAPDGFFPEQLLLTDYDRWRLKRQ